MNQLEIDRFLGEICIRGNLERYKPLISAITDDIVKRNCKISCRDDGNPSVFEHPKQGMLHIRISLRKNKAYPLHIIWDLLHEYGHLKSEVKEGSKKLDREIEAWENAHSDMHNFQVLSTKEKEFINYRDFCLASYMEEAINKSVSNLFKNQPDIFDLTEESSQTEWNLAHHLAWEIQKLLSNFVHDIEIIKREHNNKRPDIIYHKRGTNTNNLLVVEVKFDETMDAIESDVNKIKGYWFIGKLNYRFGAVINLKRDKTHLAFVFRNITA